MKAALCNQLQVDLSIMSFVLQKINPTKNESQIYFVRIALGTVRK